MLAPIPFEPRRFRTAAAHYLAGRSPYAPALFDRVALLCALRSSDHVLDLGCGPGQIARGFAPMVASVLGVDPEPAMLAAAAEASVGFDNIRWHEGSSYDLTPELGRFRLVTMGRSFHWMDRPDTLRRLDGMIEPDGAVALFHDEHPDIPDNAWYAGFREISRRYAGAVPDWRGPGWVRHDGVLLHSAFSDLETIGVYSRVELDVDTMVERALSLSSTSRAKLGDRADDMISELRAALPERMTEVVISTALIARRG